MSVDRDEVRRIAELAKLSLDDGEADRLAEEMNRILEHAERLRSLKSEPGFHPEAEPVSPASSEGGERVDTARDEGGEVQAEPSSAPDSLAHPLSDFAPEMHDGFFTVPPPPGVIGSDS